MQGLWTGRIIRSDSCWWRHDLYLSEGSPSERKRFTTDLSSVTIPIKSGRTLKRLQSVFRWSCRAGKRGHSTSTAASLHRRVKSLSHIDSSSWKNEGIRIHSEEILSCIIAYNLIRLFMIYDSEVTVHSKDMLAGYLISEKRLKIKR